jgi:hypothetical protein
MTGADLKRSRELIGLTPTQLGRLLRLPGRDPRQQIVRWEAGEAPVPGPVAVCLAYMITAGLDPAREGLAPGLEPVHQRFPTRDSVQEPLAETGPVAPFISVRDRSPEAEPPAWTAPGKNRRRG